MHIHKSFPKSKDVFSFQKNIKYFYRQTQQRFDKYEKDIPITWHFSN